MKRNTYSRSSSFLYLTSYNVEFPRLDRGTQGSSYIAGSRGQAAGIQHVEKSTLKTRKSSYWILCPLFFLSFTAVAEESGWECSVQDKANLSWTTKNLYQKAALNIAFDACRKESRFPQSCNRAAATCTGFSQTRGGQSGWQCMALDSLANAWRNTYTTHRDSAALKAKATCQRRSKIPATCYVNFISCVHVHQGSLL